MKIKEESSPFFAYTSEKINERNSTVNMTAVAIVAIIAWALVSIIENSKNKKLGKNENKEAEAYKAEIEALKERVSVLEKIVTDEKYDLKRQFADLEKDKVA